MSQSDPSKQSDEEWYSHYDVVSAPKPIIQIKPDNEIVLPVKLFRYIDHRTTCTGSVVLSLESLDGKTEVVKFYNVSIKGKKNYPAKHRGQFNPPKMGDFRKLWMAAVGKAPARWCRVHKSMRSQFKGLIFVGDYKTAYDGKDHPYNKFTELSLYEQGTD